MEAVKLIDIAEALDTDLEESGFYLDVVKAEIILIEDRVVEFIEEHLELLADQNSSDATIRGFMKNETIDRDIDEIRTLASIYDSLLYIEPFDSHEQYELMEEFIDSEEDEKVRSLLRVAIEGRGAFRRFKDSLSSIGQLQEWYDYHENAINHKAIEWCEDRNIPFT